MEFELKQQAITVKLNSSNAIRLPASLRDKFNLKKGDEFDVYLDFITQTIAFMPIRD